MHVQLISLYLLLSVYHVALITVNYMYLLRQLYQILSLYLPSPFSLLSLSLSLCRYQLYGHWKNDTYDKHPELINAKTETLSRGRYMMK